MATIKTHAEDCIRILGGEYIHVHEWMDYYAKRWNPHTYFEYHRKFRHNSKGVEYIKNKMGFYSEQAAKLHIVRDYEMFLPLPVIDIMREDQIDKWYNEALSFCDPMVEDWEKYINADT